MKHVHTLILTHPYTKNIHVALHLWWFYVILSVHDLLAFLRHSNRLVYTCITAQCASPSLSAVFCTMFVVVLIFH